MANVEAYYKNGAGATMLTSAADVDALIDAVLAEPFENSVIALYSNDRPQTEQGYPDHELRIALYAEAKVGGIRYAGSDGTARGVWYVLGAVSQRDEAFYYYQGHDEGWPQDSEVGIEQVRQAVREFVEANGVRPSGLAWASWPESIA